MTRDTRSIVVETVKENEGMNFTALKDETGLSNGVLQYHIRNSDRIVKKKGAILMKGDCDECRFCGVCRDKCIHRILRNSEKRKIVQGLADGKKQKEIADDMGLDKSTVSYHVKELREAGMLDESNEVLEPVEESSWINV